MLLTKSSSKTVERNGCYVKLWVGRRLPLLFIMFVLLSILQVWYQLGGLMSNPTFNTSFTSNDGNVQNENYNLNDPISSATFPKGKGQDIVDFDGIHSGRTQQRTQPQQLQQSKWNPDNLMEQNSKSKSNSWKKTKKNKKKLHVVSRAERPYRENAIVLLVQKNHTTYHRNSYEQLIQCLHRLHENYFVQNHGQNLNNVDIYLFHTGDFVRTDIEPLESIILYGTSDDNGRTTTSSRRSGTNNGDNQDWNNTDNNDNNVGIVKLVNLHDTIYWQLPNNRQNDNPATDWLDYHLFPMGYRHMCRFFAIQIWDVFDQLNQQQSQQQQNQQSNYRYIVRLDEDSIIHSPITYNLFDTMKQQQYVYGYRLCSYELTQNKFVPQWFDKWHNKVKPIRPIDWNQCGFYNNFFIADIQFFRTKRVQAFLHEVDRRGFIYRKRYGDLIVQSMAVYAFAKPEQIHRFLDFTYEHVTIDDRVGQTGCPIWGAIQAGYLDENSQKTLNQYQRTYLVERNCNGSVNQLTSADLSPTYSHLPASLNGSLQLATISFGKVELRGKGILSG